MKEYGSTAVWNWPVVTDHDTIWEEPEIEFYGDVPCSVHDDAHPLAVTNIQLVTPMED